MPIKRGDQVRTDANFSSSASILTALGMLYVYGCALVASGAAMSADDTIDFWFTVGSTYTPNGLTASRGGKSEWHPVCTENIIRVDEVSP
jgi:hypothetical protein